MLNRWQGIGHLGRDPETRALPSGDMVANFSVACTEKWRDKASGEPRERTEWVRCSVFGKLAEICGQYLRKGQLVYVEGRMQTREYEKDGAMKQATEIILDGMRMLGGKPDGERRDSTTPLNHAAGRAKAKHEPHKEDAYIDDDIPF